jgi:3(or 17)beta-hydroxysteroid dehydrogenase
MDRMKGKVAWVTGAAGGIGEAIARALALEGARLVVTDIEAAQEKCQALAKDIGGEAQVQDVTVEARWNELSAAIEQRYGALHVLVNSAGIEGKVGQGNAENTSLEDWQRVQKINLEAVFMGCRIAIPAMRRAGGGSIINLASIVSFFATPNAVAYGASKAGVQHLTMSVAHQGAQNFARVRCNSIHPGMIDTRMLRNIFEQGAKRLGVPLAEVEKTQLARIPMAELGRPQDIALAALYLASDESRYVTGTHLNVDGGLNIA